MNNRKALRIGSFKNHLLTGRSPFSVVCHRYYPCIFEHHYPTTKHRQMSLEKEIYQQSFRSERHKAIVNIIYTFNWLRDRMQEQFTCHDLTMQQYNILRILRGAHEPLSTLQIRERMLDKMSDTSRIVDRLIVKELVEKKTCARDKRLVDVFITEKGKILLKEMDTYASGMDNLLGTLTEEDAGNLNNLLDAVRQKTEADVEPK